MAETAETNGSGPADETSELLATADRLMDETDVEVLVRGLEEKLPEG